MNSNALIAFAAIFLATSGASANRYDVEFIKEVTKNRIQLEQELIAATENNKEIENAYNKAKIERARCKSALLSVKLDAPFQKLEEKRKALEMERKNLEKRRLALENTRQKLDLDSRNIDIKQFSKHQEYIDKIGEIYKSLKTEYIDEMRMNLSDYESYGEAIKEHTTFIQTYTETCNKTISTAEWDDILDIFWKLLDKIPIKLR